MKEIPNFPGYYATRDGQIWGDKRALYLKPDVTETGRLRVVLHKNGKYHKFFVHRLITLVYLPNPENKETVNHKDGNPQNNALDNLEWHTLSENIKHSYEVLGRVCNTPSAGKFGPDSHKSVLVQQLDPHTSRVIQEFYGMNEAQRQTNIGCTCISACCRGVQSTAGGFKWRYANKEV